MNLNEELYNLGANFVAQYAMNATGIRERVLMPSDSRVMVYGKTGFLWYLSNEAVDQVLKGDSNLVRMDLFDAVDDTVFYAVSAGVIDVLNINESVERLLPISISRDVDEAVTSALITTTFNYIGNKVVPTLQNQVIRNVRNISNILK